MAPPVITEPSKAAVLLLNITVNNQAPVGWGVSLLGENACEEHTPQTARTVDDRYIQRLFQEII